MLHKSLTHAYGGEVGYLFGVVMVGFLNPLYSHWTRLFRVIELLLILRLVFLKGVRIKNKMVNI